MSEIFFTMDVEDPDIDEPGVFVMSLRRVLDWLAREGRRGTFFVVGELAAAYPAMVKEISDAGHEIGLHGWQHVDLSTLSENAFMTETKKGKQLLESITGKQVNGYRAPMFSLTKQTPWVEGCLHRLGFSYSSSVLPASNPRFGFPGAAKQQFTWPSGLIEFPAPVKDLAGVSLPFLGGIYFRYLPNFLIEKWLEQSTSQVCWYYCHPYDFHSGKDYIEMRDTPYWVNRLLMFRRKGAFEKMQQLFAGHDSVRTLDELAKTQIA